MAEVIGSAIIAALSTAGVTVPAAAASPVGSLHITARQPLEASTAHDRDQCVPSPGRGSCDDGRSFRVHGGSDDESGGP